MDQTQAIWIKDPLSILADGAERGVVVRGGRIVELVPRGREPATSDTAVYRGRRPCRAARADQHPSSFLPDPDPGAAGRARSRTVSVAAGALSGLGAADAGIAAISASPWRCRNCCCPAAPPRPIIITCFRPGWRTPSTSRSPPRKRLGVRVLLTRGSMNRSQKDGGLPPDSVVQDEDTILADSERVVAKHHQRGEDAMVQIALAPCSPFSVTTSLMRATADARRQTRRPPAYASGRDRGREQILRADAWLPAARLSRTMRLAQRADLAGARHPLQCRMR